MRPLQTFFKISKNLRQSVILVAISAALIPADLLSQTNVIDCQEIGIFRDKADSTDESIDWMALSKQQREFSGEELLPDHEKQKDADAQPDTIGCLIENSEAPENADIPKQFLPPEQAVNLDQPQRADRSIKEEEEVRQAPKQTRLDRNNSAEEKNILARVWREATGVMRWFLVLAIAIAACLVAIILFEIYRIGVAVIIRRRTCKVPAKLIGSGMTFEGFVMVLDLRGCLFELSHREDIKTMTDIMESDYINEFDIAMENGLYEVAADTVTVNRVLSYFVSRLSTREHRQILSHSVTAPQFDKWRAIKTRRHKTTDRPTRGRD